MSDITDRKELTELPRRLNIAVVGGSLGGLFAAALLTRNGHTVTVLERSTTSLATRGAGLVARGEIFDILRGIDREDAARIGIVADERIVLDLAGDVIEREPVPQRQLSWDYVYEVFRQDVPSAEYRLGQNVNAVHPGTRHSAVELDGGRQQRFDLVVGADGRESVARKSVAPDRWENSYSGYVTWTGLVPENDLPPFASGTLLGRATTYTGVGNQIRGALVPGAGGEIGRGSRRYNWIWTRPLSEGALGRLLEESGQPTGAATIPPGELPEVLRRLLSTEAERELPFPFAAAVAADRKPSLNAVFDYVTPTMIAPRVALVGDAAVVVRPHASMSGAKAAGDAMALARFLEELPLEAALTAYERERLPVGESMASYGRIFANSLPAVSESDVAEADDLREHEPDLGKN